MSENEIREIEKKKQQLKRYKKNKACINRLEEKLIGLDEKLKSVRTPNLSGMPRGGPPVTMADMIAEKDELIQRIERLKIKGKNLRSEILSEIDTLDDCRYCEILESFFIDGVTLEDIADEKGYSPRHVYRLYSEAVTILALGRQ